MIANAKPTVTTERAAAYDITGVTENGTPSEVTKDERGNSCDRDHRADVLYGSLQTSALPVPEKRTAPRMLLQKILQIAAGSVRKNLIRKRNSGNTKAGNKRKNRKGRARCLRPPSFKLFAFFLCDDGVKTETFAFFAGFVYNKNSLMRNSENLLVRDPS